LHVIVPLPAARFNLANEFFGGGVPLEVFLAVAFGRTSIGMDGRGGTGVNKQHRAPFNIRRNAKPNPNRVKGKDLPNRIPKRPPRNPLPYAYTTNAVKQVVANCSVST